MSSTIGPCQGISIGGRFDFPVSKGGQITLSTTQDISNLQFQYASVKNPQSLSDFTPTGKALSSWVSPKPCPISCSHADRLCCHATGRWLDVHGRTRLLVVQLQEWGRGDGHDDIPVWSGRYQLLCVPPPVLTPTSASR